ncbi:unnamed protein product [Albugo candida]|uniref:Uncharacterized protein n=1 Tax=Albugo candida TaxID=65357 RepID=A0A024GJ41_9STRA|nr:unnamed protein product [Albugo candida]|eukprot:CCI46359.1 unnamed protein product [Albugo candida]
MRSEELNSDAIYCTDKKGVEHAKGLRFEMYFRLATESFCDEVIVCACRERKDPKSNTVVHSSIQYLFTVESGVKYSFISIRPEKCVLSCIVLSVSNTSIH